MKIGSREIADFTVPYIIAEIGANHNGDMNLAMKLIDAAKDCGCDAVKFQSWTPDSLIAEEEYERNQKYDDSPKKHFGSLREMVEKYYMRPENHIELKSYCEKIGIEFCSTPFSKHEVDMLEDLNVSFYKVASMDINNIELLKNIAKKRKPILLSTGMATLSEIDSAVTIIEKEKNDQIVLLHCVAVYPPDLHDLNLNNITMLRQAFGYPVGFSDHTIGSAVSLAAVAIGSCLIEKHFTIDKNLPGWDHEISADPEEMKTIVRETQNIVAAMGSYRRVVKSAEEEKKLMFRRSIVLSRDLKAGDKLTTDDLLFKRPGNGIRPDEIKYVVGRKLKRDLYRDDLIRWEDFI